MDICIIRKDPQGNVTHSAFCITRDHVLPDQILERSPNITKVTLEFTDGHIKEFAKVL